MSKPSKNKMAAVNAWIQRSIKSIFNVFLLKMLLRSLPVYILKQLFLSISVNSGRTFTSPLRGSVNILPLFTSISKNNCYLLCYYYSIASRATQSNSVYVNVLEISIVHADSVSIAWANSFARIFFFCASGSCLRGGNIIFRDNNWYKQRLCPPVPKRKQFWDLFYWARVLKWDRRENNGKGDSASVPSRFASLNNHFWYCCLFFASDLMHNSTGYVIKQLVHAFSCALSSYGALGKFVEHSRS